MPDLSERLIEALHGIYGAHPGQRAAHASGVLCHATFVATPAAASLSRAAHFVGEPTRAHVRFSTGSGNPSARDTARDGRGAAVKFYLPDGTTTDLVMLTQPVFFSRTPEDLIAFDEARRIDPETGKPDLARVAAFLEEHPETVPAVTAVLSAPTPATYAAGTYHALHAFGFVAADGTVRHGRYDLVPEADDEPLELEVAKAAQPDHLRVEMGTRLEAGPVVFHLDVQLAEEDDSLVDPTQVWPDEREVVRMGRLELTGLAFDRERDGDILVFDPTRVTDGIVLTDDPILHARPGAYSISIARRTAG